MNLYLEQLQGFNDFHHDFEKSLKHNAVALITSRNISKAKAKLYFFNCNYILLITSPLNEDTKTK